MNAINASGNVNFTAGGRFFDDEELWEPTENQTAFGVNVGFGPDEWPVALVVGAHVSGDRDRVTLGSDSGEIHTDMFEFSLGVQKVWVIGASRPFIGGGVSAAEVDAELDAFGERVDDDDRTVGGYLEGGIFWRLGSRFNIGLSARALMGTDIEIDFSGPVTAEGNADYVQVGVILGWGWPSSHVPEEPRFKPIAPRNRE